MGFLIPRIFSELRELLQEYPGTVPELREWPFHSESVFPKIGVVPRLLAIECKSPVSSHHMVSFALLQL